MFASFATRRRPLYVPNWVMSDEKHSVAYNWGIITLKLGANRLTFDLTGDDSSKIYDKVKMMLETFPEYDKYFAIGVFANNTLGCIRAYPNKLRSIFIDSKGHSEDERENVYYEVDEDDEYANEDDEYQSEDRHYRNGPDDLYQ